MTLKIVSNQAVAKTAASTDGRAVQKSSRTLRREAEAAQYDAARQFMAENEVGIVHLRQQAIQDGELFGSHTGGITVAYRKEKNVSYMEIATAICSDKDIYDRKRGTVVAVEQFANLRRIRVPLFGAHPADAVEHLFSGYLTFVDE